MHAAAPTRVVALSGIVIALAACGGGARGRAWPPAGPPPAAGKELPAPAHAYRIIYSPPVDLAKPPDTTGHGHKPRSQRPGRGLAPKSAHRETRPGHRPALA